MVPFKIVRSKAGRCLPVVLATLLFAGCSLNSTDQSSSLLAADIQGNSTYYLQQMQQTHDDNRTTWQLLAVRSLLKEGKQQQAVALYNQLPHGLSGDRGREYTLQGAEISLLRKDFTGVRSRLVSLNPDALSASQQSRYWQLQIAASQGKPSLSLLRALVAVEPTLQGAAKQKNIDVTWQALTAMTPAQARGLVIYSHEATLQGWLDLQQSWLSNRNDPKLMQAAIVDWRTRYPHNPGATMLPTALKYIQSYRPASTHKIALLLPLSGQAAAFGRTIQTGFEAAKNAAINPVQVPVSADAGNTSTGNSSAVSTASADELLARQRTAESTPALNQPAAIPAKNIPEINVYDTATRPVEQIIAQAQQDGASLIVGPLLKDDVSRMLTSNTPLNVLALNQTEKISGRANICYFALSPEDEARNAAEHIWAQGRRSPLVLAPRNALGNRVIKAFAQAWQQQGGTTVLQQNFGSQADLRSAINKGTGLALNGTPVNGSQAQSPNTMDYLSIDSQSQPTGTQTSSGPDAVYIVASSGEIALIKPMIAMRTGSQSNVKLYASSRSAQSGTGADFRLEMEGLEYSEIPLLAGANPAMLQQALSVSRNDYSLTRLYAMGADAWTLASQFSQLRHSPDHQISGNTGVLTASQDCVVTRKMSWLRYQQGRTVPVN